MIQDPLMKKVFPKSPMFAFKQSPNLRKIICRAKLPAQNQAKRKPKGVKPCKEPCNQILQIIDLKEKIF